jgi:uncharacterized protein
MVRMSQKPARSPGSWHTVTIPVRVRPRAGTNEIVAVLSDGKVKIHLTSPPVGGRANETLLKFMAEILDVPVSNLKIVTGMGSRDKLISVANLDATMINKKIQEHVRLKNPP